MNFDVAESVKESDEEKAAEDENKQVGQGEGGVTCTADRGERVAATSIPTTVTAASAASTVDVSVTVSESATPVSTSVTTQAEITPVNSNTTGKEYKDRGKKTSTY